MNTTQARPFLGFVSLSSRLIRRLYGYSALLVLLTVGVPLSAQLNQNAPVWSSYSPGHFYHRDFSVAGFSTTASPNALPLSEPLNVDYTFPTYSQPGNGFYEYANGINFTDPRDSSQRCTIPPGDVNQATPNPNRYWIIGGVYNHGVPIARAPQSAHVSDFQPGIKGLLFQGSFSGTASGTASDAALAVVYYHQEACYAGHFEYGFSYDFVPQFYPGTAVQKSPFYFYWSKETNCFGTCFADVAGTTPVGHQDGTTNDLATTTPTLRYTPLPDLRTTANSLGQFVWGVSAYFDYSAGGNFRVQIWDPNNFSLLYDQIITPVINTGLSGSVFTTTPFAIDQVSGGAAGSPSYAVNGTSAYVTAGFSLVGSPTPGTLPNFHLDYLKAGK
jgi:hypothetical protein